MGDSPKHPPRLHVSVTKALDSDLIDGANNYLVAYDGSMVGTFRMFGSEMQMLVKLVFRNLPISLQKRSFSVHI